MALYYKEKKECYSIDEKLLIMDELTFHKLEVNWPCSDTAWCLDLAPLIDIIEALSKRLTANPVHSLTVLGVPFLTDHGGKSLVAALPIPPVVDMTSGVKVACSTSRILCSYCLLFSCSCRLYTDARGLQ